MVRVVWPINYHLQYNWLRKARPLRMVFKVKRTQICIRCKLGMYSRNCRRSRHGDDRDGRGRSVNFDDIVTFEPNQCRLTCSEAVNVDVWGPSLSIVVVWAVSIVA